MEEVAPDEIRLKRDREHINLLAIFHCLNAVFALMGIIFLAFHFFMMNSVFGDEEFWKVEGTEEPINQPFNPTEFFSLFRWFYALMGLFFIASCLINILSAVFMKQRRFRLFSMVVAGLNCLSVPVGTLLGVFTFMVLLRPTVEATYWENTEEE